MSSPAAFEEAVEQAPARGTLANTRSDRRGTVRPYDFRRPTKLSRDHVRLLQIAYETFARQYTTLLTSTLRVVGQVTLASVEQLTYDEYVGTLNTPTFMAIVALDPLPGRAVLEFSMASALAIVDHSLGGPGGEQPVRPMTEIESTLVRGFTDRVLRELAYAFTSLATVSPRVEKLEYNPQFAQTSSSSDTVIVASFEMSIGREQCTATMCVPFTSLFPLLEAVTEAPQSAEHLAAQSAAARAIELNMEDVPVDVAVRFAPTPVTPGDMAHLVVGDVLQLGHPTAAPLDITVADVTFARAVPGNRGRRLACLIVDPPHEENPS